MSTLKIMRDRISSELLRDSNDDDRIDDGIRSALRYYSGWPLWFLEATTTLTLLSGEDNVALPSNFGALQKDGLRLYASTYWRNQGNGFDYHSWQELRDTYRRDVQSGEPCHCAIFAKSVYVDTLASQDYSISVDYYKKDATLPTADGATSVMFDEAYDLIRAHATAIFKEESLEYEDTSKDWISVERYKQALIDKNIRYRGLYA